MELRNDKWIKTFKNREERGQLTITGTRNFKNTLGLYKVMFKSKRQEL